MQYCLQYTADQISQTSSGIMGGPEAGSVPTNDIVSGDDATVFELNPAPSGPPPGSLSLNLQSGHLTADWIINGRMVGVSGDLRCIESLTGPSDRFLFAIDEAGSGFYVLSTTNI